MTFNWPDIPFSGTEVDAFVVAYKEFAQDVLDAYLTEFNVNNSLEHIHLPYLTQENMKIYLENALLYSAFVVKQRAGNSGPGTDFELGNSPLNVPLNNSQSATLAGRLGCHFDNDKMDICYENGDPDNPDDDSVGPADGGSGGSGGSNTGAFGSEINPEEDQTQPDKPCDTYTPNPNDPTVTVNGEPVNPARQAAWLAYAATLKTVGYGQAATTVDTSIASGSLYMSADFILHYLGDSGSQYTEIGLPPVVHTALGQEINAYVNKYLNVSNGDGRMVREIPLSESTRALYGMSPGDKMYQVDFYSYLWLASAFGGARIITDGSETDTSVGGLLGNINYVKAVIDDYDFKYAYEIKRAADLPGLPLLPEDTIQSGPLICPPNGDPRSVCEALVGGGHSNVDYVVRLPVTEAHGDGCTDIEENPNPGRPFPTYIKFNRTYLNGL